MASDKVYTPEVIEENPFPSQDNADVLLIENKTSGDTFSPSTTKDNPLPTKKIATELISSVLNTKTRKITNAIDFTPSGALQIGNYQDGESGDIRISRNGIVARNVFGTTTFALDGDTGDATFSGTLQAGTIIGAGSNVIIDEVDGNGRILILGSDGIPQILIGYGDF